MIRAIASLLAAAAVLPATARAQPSGTPESAAPSGVVVTADLGGGGAIGAGSEYPNSGVFEAELGIGYELLPAIRPELDFVIGLEPNSNFALRPGVHVALPGVPFFLRAAFDFSTARSSFEWRWMLLGAGAELRLTGVLGAFVEADLGIPTGADAGVPLLARAGLSFRF